MWSVHIEDVKTKEKQIANYDAVIVCNGHYNDPFIPDIEGIEDYSGTIRHSHEYRSPETYRDRIVLILGAGPSGIDISHQIAGTAKRVNTKISIFSVPANCVQSFS